jgi:hypothetical protein
MDWVLYLLLLDLHIGEFCNSFISPSVTCAEQVKECVLDGETLEWCQNTYTEGALCSN